MSSFTDAVAKRKVRIFIRGTFVVLVLATVFLSYFTLRWQQERAFESYIADIGNRILLFKERLQNPGGQLALLNAELFKKDSISPLHPYLLPYSAIETEDPAKARDTVDKAGCWIRYSDSGSLCVAVGNTGNVGSYIYIAGSFSSVPLTVHAVGQPVNEVHRLRISVEARGSKSEWLATFQSIVRRGSGHLAGNKLKVTGYRLFDTKHPVRDDKDFRGSIRQELGCIRPVDFIESGISGLEQQKPSGTCIRESFFSLRLPIESFRNDAFIEGSQWPPADIFDTVVRVQILSPDSAPGSSVLLDSNSPKAKASFSLSDLRALLKPHERLRISKKHSGGLDENVVDLLAVDDGIYNPSWLEQLLVRARPMDMASRRLYHDTQIILSQGEFNLALQGDQRNVESLVSSTAYRLSFFIPALLCVIAVTWFAIELVVVRRIRSLTQRALSVSVAMSARGNPDQIDFSDLLSRDELGILASGLNDLLHRVNEDLKKQRQRIDQDRAMWEAVAHEILSPLQSLSALHYENRDRSMPYVQRMLRAVKNLYGATSPSEAIQSASIQLAPLDLNEFLRQLSENASKAQIPGIRFFGIESELLVHADAIELEVLIEHVLSNAHSFRYSDTEITVRLYVQQGLATIDVHNIGPHIEARIFNRIFEYGVSSRLNGGIDGNRGQGLFVAKTNVMKMGGTIVAENVPDGVCFRITLPVIAGDGRRRT